MMRRRLYTLLYIIALLAAHSGLQAAAFSHYMYADGLSDNNVLCALRDSYGFMWLGTHNGLNRFDGMQNTVYRNMVDDDVSFENNTITTLFEHGPDIWFGGSFGLYVYDRQKNSFSRFNKKTRYGVTISCTVRDILKGRNGHIWIATLGQGLFVYNPAIDVLTQDSRRGAFLSDILTADDGRVYIASLSGVILVYDQDMHFVQQYAIPDYETDKNFITLETVGGRLYVGTDQGLYSLADGQLTQNSTQTGIHALCCHGGKLLLGTEQGLLVYNPLTQDVGHYGGADGQGLGAQHVNEVLFDSDSTLWVLTQMSGVFYKPLLDLGVNAETLTADGSGTMVRAVCEAPDGNLWVGTDHGLYTYDRRRRLISGQITVNGGRRTVVVQTDEVNALLLDGTDLWIGTRHDGIIVLNTADGSQRHYEYSANRSYTLPSNEVICLLRSSQGVIYVGTSWGLCRYERDADNFKWYFGIGSMTTVNSLTEDKNGCVWVATANHGLFRQNAPGGDFRNYTFTLKQPAHAPTTGQKAEEKGVMSIPSNDVSTVFCDHDGTVWVATTGGGLCRYRPDVDGFEPFAAAISTLQQQQVYFIVEDQQHCLWLGMETGMTRIDKDCNENNVRELRGLGLTRVLKPFNSAMLTRDGELFAGRFNLLAHFYPARIDIRKDQSPVYVTSLTLPFRSDEDERQAQSRHQWPMTSGSIILNYADNSFTLHFSSPQYRGDEDFPIFEYMLQGIDKTWARGTRNAEATYVQVPPGKYTFLLRKAGNTDESSYARLTIEVLPPWYRSALAYMIYTVLLVAAVFYAMRLYSNRLRKGYNERMKAYQAEQERASFESKIRFFINLVHEIRTPLTLITLPLEAMEGEMSQGATGTTTSGGAEESRTSGVTSHIAAIRRNVNYLLGITNQLLDFQKAETGKMQLTCRRCDVGELLTGVYQQFEDAITVQGKHLQLQLPDQPLVTALDVDKVQKVLMNLLGNAGKYARTEIIVRLEQLSLDKLRVSVIDDGPGVPPQERDKIFDLYYQIGNDSVAATLGTGLGLSYAKMLALAHDGDLLYSDAVGGGSNFQLVLPIKIQEVSEAPQAPPSCVPLVASEQSSGAVGGTTGTSHRILIVEDNEELLLMTCEALRPNYRILKARDGVEALDVLRYNDIDVIVSDVMMPRMDGNELCRQVKQDINYSHIPVILLTAKTSVEAKVEGMQSGADVYLEKPFSVRQLHLQIQSLLRMRQNFYERMRQIDGFMPQQDSELGMNQQDLQFMERLQQLVSDNMHDEDFSIDVLAEQMNMSRSSFYRKIKALTDMTPIEYLKKRRLEQAAQLLSQGIRVTEVAGRVGFTSSSYFAKCFKARFGVLPKDYVAASAWPIEKSG